MSTTVIEQIQNDFAADDIRVRGYYIYVGPRMRSFINVDEREVAHTRADGNRGRNYILFLAMYLYTRFGLIPARETLCFELVSEIELARERRFHERMRRLGQGVGYIEYHDGERWCVRAVPYTDLDYAVRIPLPEPGLEAESEEEELEELEAVDEDYGVSQLTGPDGSSGHYNKGVELGTKFS